MSSPFPTPSPVRSFSLWPALALVAVVVLAYWPSLRGGLLWDDDGHVTQVQLQSAGGLARIWTEPSATQQYYPVLHSAFWLEHRLWGDNPLGYRLLNLFLHAGAACLFAALLRRLAVPGAWLAAFLFALHPVCVESVAWIAEQKNTLSLCFYLSAALLYLRFEDTRRPGVYAVATLLFAGALLSKTVTVTLPAALLVVLFWRRERLAFRRDVAPLLPWFALGLAAGLMTVWNERVLIGAKGGDFALSWAERLLLAGRVLWFYLGKLLLPVGQSFIYPRWEVTGAQVWQWVFPAAALVLTGFLCWRKRLAGVRTAWLVFAGTLFPALGFFNVYPFLFSYVADHFQYHASLPLFALAGAGLARLAPRVSRGVRVGSIGLLCLLLGVLSWRQSEHYTSNTALWEATLERNPDCWLAHNNLAQQQTDAGRPELAVEHLTKALTLRPRFAEAENNLGHALVQLGRQREALVHFQKAIALQPSFAQAYNNLGLAQVALGDREAALVSFGEAIRHHPRYPVAHFNLGLALAQSRRTAEALQQFEKAVLLDPEYGDAELNWAIGLMLSGRFPQAVPHFERALVLAGEAPGPFHLYGRALAAQGRLEEAVRLYEQALDRAPEDAAINRDLEAALRRLGRL